jgi:uncharacterized protein (TIGR02117 family)
LTLVLLLGMYLAASFILSRIPVRQEPITSSDVTVFIVTSGIHTDLVLPVKSDQINWSEKVTVNEIKQIENVGKYVAFGWGNREFYMKTPAWADLKFSTALKAVFGLGPSAMHVTFFPDVTEGPDCMKIILNRDQYARLVRYIKQSFVKDSNDDFVRIYMGSLYGPGESFYEANGQFSLFFTCNTWVNTGLKECGQKACLWTPFDRGIFYQYNPVRVVP